MTHSLPRPLVFAKFLALLVLASFTGSEVSFIHGSSTTLPYSFHSGTPNRVWAGNYTRPAASWICVREIANSRKGKRLNEISTRGPLFTITVKESCKRKKIYSGAIHFRRLLYVSWPSRDRRGPTQCCWKCIKECALHIWRKKAEDKLIPYSCYNVWFGNFSNNNMSGS